ncbi:MAG: bifunctional phosphopantothenoylcysteine decarboxylase/phosphopantothenate--cysteine ligase CoaBC [Firmicutes bacterium HGW-Firmicutes-2]|jgi:phosphopantothenoylcysteine decarboxylase/phosphopantothenate--cysteine ligase|nr:MAG: bifunctional phosphopantothenoylcysteine decarboxylase/phosphopantothenate--cysteine ligase CoaBC [Firmicutes bacterium HGW-Firmicutes-2]
MKTIVVGVCGGIAGYKAIEIVHSLTKKGYDVHVIMTKNATEFITPLTFQSLSHNPVVTDMFNPIDKWDTKHIQLAKKADLFLIAPATANIIGKIACGIADDMLSTTVMATKAPVIIAPAMNTNMWENPILKDNVRKLTTYGYKVLETGHGQLACGDIGTGKLLDWTAIVTVVENSLL